MHGLLSSCCRHEGQDATCIGLYRRWIAHKICDECVLRLHLPVLQAVGRDGDCIELYKKLEDTHPLRKVRQQAANLRFILQAPKLERGPDEVIQLPILNAEERKKFVLFRT